jgi:hypothetical protein
MPLARRRDQNGLINVGRRCVGGDDPDPRLWSAQKGPEAKPIRRFPETVRSRVAPSLPLLQVVRAATGRQMRRNPDGGGIIKSAVAVVG